MEKIKSFFSKYRLILLIASIILITIAGRLYYNNNFKRLIKVGCKSVAYVYKTKAVGRSSGRTAEYYFYVSKYKFTHWFPTPEDFYPENKFYIVYYLPDNPKNSVLDFNKEIYPDSVYKYFPVNQNPFEKEIREAKSKY